jgi:subtilase family serine protease
MPTLIIHCLNSCADKQDIINQAQCSSIDYKHVNDSAIQLDFKDDTSYNTFVSNYENDQNFGVFYDNGDCRNVKDVFRNPCAVNPVQPTTVITTTITTTVTGDETTTTTSTSTKTKDASLASSVTVPGSGTNGNLPSVLASYYKYPPVDTTVNPVIAIISLGGGYSQADLTTFWTTYNPKNASGQPIIPNLINVNNVPTTYGRNESRTNNDLENMLDIEIIGNICPTATILFYSGVNTTTGFYNIINSAIGGYTSTTGTHYQPSIISISWGNYESSFGTTYLASYNQLFQTAVGKGVTICAAAGDNGSSDGLANNIPNVDFPSSSPYVVSCGGTSLAGSTETAWVYNASQQWGTGGGISSYFVEPSYQTDICTFPTTYTPSTISIANLKGKRFVPDLALNADPLSGWNIMYLGKLVNNTIGGTSCVAPAISALLGLMNLNYTKASPYGFNGVLYSLYKGPNITTCFNDIIVGSNDDVSVVTTTSTGRRRTTNTTPSTGLYNAGVGYDCCTGLGSVNGTNLYTALKNSVAIANIIASVGTSS